MPEFLDNLPFWVAFTALALGAMARGQMMFWIGRIATEQTLKRTRPSGGWKATAHRWLSGGAADAGIVVIRRWGLIAIPFSYLTVGLQSMIQAGAGVLRIPWWQFSLAQVPGALAWGAIYATFGFVTWNAIGAAASGNPVAAIGLGLLALLLVGALIVLKRRTAALATGPQPELADDKH